MRNLSRSYYTTYLVYSKGVTFALRTCPFLRIIYTALLFLGRAGKRQMLLLKQSKVGAHVLSDNLPQNKEFPDLEQSCRPPISGAFPLL